MSLTLREIEVVIHKSGVTCDCGREITTRAERYDHDGGVPVKGFAEKQWVYFNCPKCGYDWALWKLLNRITGKYTRGVEAEVLGNEGGSEMSELEKLLKELAEALFYMSEYEPALSNREYVTDLYFRVEDYRKKFKEASL